MTAFFHPWLRSLSIVALLALQGPPAMAIEEPRYQVLFVQGEMEVRQYAPMLIAETFVEGDMDEASNKGFRLIADFIFGNNQGTPTQAGAKIAMTAPVTVEPQPTKIAMTSPVTVEPHAPTANPAQRDAWRIHFVMPSQYTLETLPKPNNPAVNVRTLPAKRFVVLRYSGLNTQARVQAKTKEALAWAKSQAFTVIGTPQLARYDPPWILPFFRRNEILIEVAAP